MHISITGDLGSGKSTVAKEICSQLNLKYLSTGLIQRQLGQQMGMNTLEFNKYANENKEVDDYIDQKLKDVNEQTEPHLLDSRLGWHFVNKSFKIYLMAIDEVAAARVLADEKRIGEPQAHDMQQKLREQKERRKIENERFEKIYGIKPSIFKDFDAIIDSSTASIEEVKNLILSLYDKYSNGKEYHKIWLSPLRLFPTTDINTVNKAETEALRIKIKVEKFDIKYPVDCVLYHREFFIYDGHKRVSASLQNGLPIIPVRLVGKNEEMINDSLNVEHYLKENFTLNKVHDWEKAHHFKFFHYPADEAE